MTVMLVELGAQDVEFLNGIINVVRQNYGQYTDAADQDCRIEINLHPDGTVGIRIGVPDLGLLPVNIKDDVSHLVRDAGYAVVTVE